MISQAFISHPSSRCKYQWGESTLLYFCDAGVVFSFLIIIKIIIIIIIMIIIIITKFLENHSGVFEKRLAGLMAKEKILCQDDRFLNFDAKYV